MAASLAFATSLVGFGLAAAPASAAALPPQARHATTITVQMSPNKITYSGPHSVPAGAYIFDAKGAGHDNTLVLLSLVNGYPMAQARHDVGAVMSGNGPANTTIVKRIDQKIHWLGGTGAPVKYEVSLQAGRYLMINEAPGTALASLEVTGSGKATMPAPANSTVMAIPFGMNHRFSTPATLPHTGWWTFVNHTDEPHFLAIVGVKASTTDADIRKHLKDENPPFILPQTASSGPLSPHLKLRLYIDLPKGKYLIACFWPSDDNGMPHAFMGMWKLVTLS
jgi:hypothetical protein